MTVYGYARVSIREPEDKNLDLQVERLVRAGCSMGNVRAEEASGAKDDRGGLLELLDLVVEGDTLVVTHIDRLSRGLTYGLQVIEDLHLRGVEFRSLSEDFDTSTATGKLQLAMVLAFSEWWRNSIRDRSVAGQAPGGQPLDHPAGGQVGVGWAMQPRHGAWPVGRLAEYQRGQSCGKVLQAVHAGPRDLSGDDRFPAAAKTSKLLTETETY